MSRLTLCIVTAAVLATLSLAVMAVRHQVLGEDIKVPAGPGTYQVMVVVRGKASDEVKLTTACPLDIGRQHIFREEFHSAELGHKPPDGRHPDRRLVQWSERLKANTPFQTRYEFYCRLNVHHPTTSMARLARTVYAAPKPGECIGSEPKLDPSDPGICELALDLTGGVTRPADQARTLFRYVDESIGNEPAAGGPGLSAAECFKAGRGDAVAKSRLLVALCRNRGIPARLVTGLILNKSQQQQAHTWAEAWVGDHWMPFCPFNHHCGRVPASYLIFGFGDLPLVRGHNVRGLSYACLVEHKPLSEEAAAQPSWLRRLFERVSFSSLPPSETGLVEFLLLLPIAALIISLYRNLIGVQSFGTFAPALIGLAFRRSESLPGIMVFVSIILIGWGLRRVLDRYHLLQVPRTAFLLSLVVLVLLTAILVANYHELSPTRYISLFPMVILTGMIERFWTLETEDGTAASFKTLLGTMLIAGSISLVLSWRDLVTHMFHYPETLGLFMAVQLLIGRYTGYRLSELLRFRDFMQRPPRDGGPVVLRHEHFAIKADSLQRN